MLLLLWKSQTSIIVVSCVTAKEISVTLASVLATDSHPAAWLPIISCYRLLDLPSAQQTMKSKLRPQSKQLCSSATVFAIWYLFIRNVFYLLMIGGFPSELFLFCWSQCIITEKRCCGGTCKNHHLVKKIETEASNTHFLNILEPWQKSTVATKQSFRLCL